MFLQNHHLLFWFDHKDHPKIHQTTRKKKTSTKIQNPQKSVWKKIRTTRNHVEKKTIVIPSLSEEEILNKLRGHEFRVDEAPQVPSWRGFDPRAGGAQWKWWSLSNPVVFLKPFGKQQLWVFIKLLWKWKLQEFELGDFDVTAWKQWICCWCNLSMRSV